VNLTDFDRGAIFLLVILTLWEWLTGRPQLPKNAVELLAMVAVYVVVFAGANYLTGAR